MSRAFAPLLACLLLSSLAQAQVTPPPPLPPIPDEPLPDWHPPAKPVQTPLYLTVAPEMVEAQRGRQAGMWISAIGWMSLLGAGILAVHAADISPFVGQPHIVGQDINGNTIVVRNYDAVLLPEQQHYQAAALSLAIVGTTMAVGGFVLFTVEQARISKYHKRRPKDPLPPLSGY